ncbi:MAG: nucleotidyltransferase family protein [Microcoleus sp. PH2017_40_RAT_O_B]|jgi:D-glycero-alpha-D-manno-heptose 1-phosphate guanylyltransferase|uniref:nucleotidyltransferase family protein n=1 Tax=unclassified Microcoleus TaxID=2642155 RepID=UPI001D5F176E|nr:MULTISPECIES: nucleotidyltransferase family protein [unclassified Microcoleus]MCC3571004.1 nucleotidyltransferase family protein [Microcoleus sp. PH2017_34_RAT_O_A]MCC3608617.1 nucleotidyltransferase family protein [Microcoleus sp. PH2017_40_RAT_O_B]
MADLGQCTAVILAGGLGTRLRSVVADRPKVMAEVRGQPFLTYLLEHLAQAGFKHTVLCTGYLGEQVKATFGDTYSSLHLQYSQEFSPLGTAGALRLALPLFQSEQVVAINGDSFCNANLRDFWTWYRDRKDAKGALLLTEVPDTKRYGRVQVDPSGQVLKFEEKGGTEGAGWINAGIYLLERRLLSTIPKSCAVSLETEMFPAWIGQGLYGYCSQGRFLDIGTPESYAIADNFLSVRSPKMEN